MVGYNTLLWNMLRSRKGHPRGSLWCCSLITGDEIKHTPLNPPELTAYAIVHTKFALV